MFFPQAFSSLVCMILIMILQLAILYYLIKIYRTMGRLSRQQPEARSNRGGMNDIAGRHIRHAVGSAVEQDEREG